MRPAGGVDQDIKSAEPFGGQSGKTLGIRLEGDVADQRESVDAGIGERAGRRLRVVFFQTGDGQTRAGAAERLGDHPPETVRAARN